MLPHSLARLLHSAGITHAQYSMCTLYLGMHVHKHIPQWSSRNYFSAFMAQLCCVFWTLQSQRREVAPLSLPSTSKACQQAAWGLGSLGHDPAQRLRFTGLFGRWGKTKAIICVWGEASFRSQRSEQTHLLGLLLLRCRASFPPMSCW